MAFVLEDKTVSWDELFKSWSMSFFPGYGCKVHTEVEIYDLPRKLDVLLVNEPSRASPAQAVARPVGRFALRPRKRSPVSGPFLGVERA